MEKFQVTSCSIKIKLFLTPPLGENGSSETVASASGSTVQMIPINLTGTKENGRIFIIRV